MINNPFPFKNLVLEGGDSKAFCYCGPIKVLEESGILKNITRFAFCSSGSAIGTLLASGYTADELEEIYTTTKFSDFLDHSFFLHQNVTRMLNQYGWYKGNAIKQFMSKHLLKKVHTADNMAKFGIEYIKNIKDLTFEQHHKIFGTEIYIGVTFVNTVGFKLLSYKTHPDLSVVDAIRASCSIPIVYKSVKIDGDIAVDGGIGNNYPLTAFDDEFINYETLGLKLMGSTEKRNGHIYENTTISGIVSYASEVIDFLIAEIERLRIKDGYWERTITVDTQDLLFLDISIRKKKIRDLIDLNYDLTKKYLEYYMRNRQFPLKKL